MNQSISVGPEKQSEIPCVLTVVTRQSSKHEGPVTKILALAIKVFARL